MAVSLRMQARKALQVFLAFFPWIVSMYVLYWLEYGEIWTTETAHRGKISVGILVIGMGLSFLVQSHFAKREHKQ